MKKKLKFLFWIFLERIIRMSITPNMRAFLIKIFGGYVGKQVYIHDVIFQNIYVNGFKNFTAKNKATIQSGCIIDLSEQVILDEMTTISQGVIVCTHSNPGKKLGKPLSKIYPPEYKKVHFKKACWIGAGSIILPGVTIGVMSVVAAGSVVTNDVPPAVVVAGVPSKVVKKLDAAKID